MVLIYNIWKCTPTASNGVNFAKDYEKDSYNKWIFIEKNINDKKHINHIQKTFIVFNMQNFKTLKIERMFQNCFKILEFQESFTTNEWVIIYMMYEKNYSLEYNKSK